jgi:hypothetical protein
MILLTALPAFVVPVGQLPPWLQLVAGAALFVGGVVIYFGGRRRGH